MILIICSTGASSWAGVTVFDDVILAGESVKLTALAKGRFFPEGGRLVAFYADGEHIDTNLSGGDGYAFLAYRPASKGIIRLKVKADEDEDEGTLLVAAPEDRMVLVEIEGAVIDNIISFEPRPESGKALHEISERFRLIYVSTFAGMARSRDWLAENGFPVSPVLKWDGPETLAGLRGKGLHIQSVIGSPRLLSDLQDVPDAYSFKDTEHGTVVSGWEELKGVLLDGSGENGK